MTFTIYQIQEYPDSTTPFYEVGFNNLISALETPDSIMKIIEKIEDKSLEQFHHLIFHRLESVYDYYSTAHSCTIVYEHEFEDSEDLQENLRNLIQKHHPELLI